MASTGDLSSALLLENGTLKSLSREHRKHSKHGRSAHNMSTSSLRKKSDLTLVSKVRFGMLRNLLGNVQQVILGTKLAILFVAIPLAIIAHARNYGRPWVFGLSLLGLTPLAERVSFLTEQIAFYTVGGLLNATCGNATELIIAIFALVQRKVDVVKYSLLGSILSNLLLVLGTSLLCCGVANIRKEQNFDRRQADVNSILLLLGLLCHALPLLFRYSESSESSTSNATLLLSRVSCIFMIIAYFGYLIFQLWTHRQLFEAEEVSNFISTTSEEEEGDDDTSDETPVICFWSGFAWLVGMTIIIAILSEYIVGTIEDASKTIIFAFKNKLDISLGVALGSATQIDVFVVPLTAIVAWIIGLPMDLDFGLLGIGSLSLAIIVTAFTLQITLRPPSSEYLHQFGENNMFHILDGSLFFH
ncbi:hypothetical protein Leryth_003511 [Lithospermum erythrorhizon]|nr:hypothetical protein Leryth_003511 [Lithospermum erythrorhizon]